MLSEYTLLYSFSVIHKLNRPPVLATDNCETALGVRTNCFKKISIKKTHEDAKKRCAELGMFYPTVANSSINNEIVQIVGNLAPVGVGIETSGSQWINTRDGSANTAFNEFSGGWPSDENSGRVVIDDNGVWTKVSKDRATEFVCAHHAGQLINYCSSTILVEL